MATIATLTGYLVINTQQSISVLGAGEAAALRSSVGVRLEPIGGHVEGFITVDVPTSALAGLTSGASCTVTITDP